MHISISNLLGSTQYVIQFEYQRRPYKLVLRPKGIVPVGPAKIPDDHITPCMCPFWIHISPFLLVQQKPYPIISLTLRHLEGQRAAVCVFFDCAPKRTSY